MEENSPQGIWDHIAEKMLVEFAESGHPIFRATTPLSRCKLESKGHRKLSIHFAADGETIDTVFRIIVSANQLSLYGAVLNMCEECESLHDRSGQHDVVMGQSIVLSEIKTEVPLENDDPAYQNFLLQRYEERIQSLSRTDRVSKICMDAGFISVVEVGQYFMTKDNGEQFYAKACREYTLPRNDGSSQPKGWIQGNTKIGPVLEVTTSCLYGKHGVSLLHDQVIKWTKAKVHVYTDSGLCLGKVQDHSGASKKWTDLQVFSVLSVDRMYTTWTLTSLYTNIVPSLFFLFKACPQTDTAQLYNT